MESVAQQSVADDKPWRFKPGQSGNPSGKPRKTAEQRQLEAITRKTVDRHLEQRLGPAFKALDKALKDADVALALKAALRVIEYAAGTPVSTQVVRASIEGTDTVQRLTADDIASAARVFLLRQGAAQSSEVP